VATLGRARGAIIILAIAGSGLGGGCASGDGKARQAPPRPVGVTSERSEPPFVRSADDEPMAPRFRSAEAAAWREAQRRAATETVIDARRARQPEAEVNECAGLTASARRNCALETAGPASRIDDIPRGVRIRYGKTALPAAQMRKLLACHAAQARVEDSSSVPCPFFDTTASIAVGQVGNRLIVEVTAPEAVTVQELRAQIRAAIPVKPGFRSEP
jgi:hypothetical protein